MDKVKSPAPVNRGRVPSGGGGGNRTPVRETFSRDFYARSLSFESRRPKLRKAGSRASQPLSSRSPSEAEEKPACFKRRPLRSLAGKASGRTGYLSLSSQCQRIVGSWNLPGLLRAYWRSRRAIPASTVSVETGSPPWERADCTI